MNRIITIAREFGSGGRELGKRLSELLGFAYYDKEIVEEIARRTQLAESYVQQIIEQKHTAVFPINVGRTLSHSLSNDYVMKQFAAVYAEQANVLREMSQKSSCIIVGRCADYILRDKDPLRLFVYADIDSRMERCRLKADETETLTDKQLRREILKIDKNRAAYYEYYTGRTWGDHANYDLCINTSRISVKECAKMLANMLQEEAANV